MDGWKVGQGWTKIASKQKLHLTPQTNNIQEEFVRIIVDKEKVIMVVVRCCVTELFRHVDVTSASCGRTSSWIRQPAGRPIERDFHLEIGGSCDLEFCV